MIFQKSFPQATKKFLRKIPTNVCKVLVIPIHIYKSLGGNGFLGNRQNNNIFHLMAAEVAMASDINVNSATIVNQT